MNTRIATLEQARATLGELIDRADQLIYLHPAFLDFLERTTGGSARIVLAEAGGETVGALPYLVRDQPGVGRVVNSLPWYGSHGSCVLDRSRGDADDIRHALLSAFREAIAGPDLISTTVILSHEEEGARAVYTNSLEPTATDLRLGQITPLPGDVGPSGETLLSVFEQKTRNLVRKSLRQGFAERVADDDDAWDFLHRIHTDNIQALGGAAKPRTHFEALRETLPPATRRLSLATDGGVPVAALLLLYGGRTVEYVTPAIEVSARSRQPLSFLIWNGMTDAIARGFRAWNWGGTWSGQHSLRHFKTGFGAEDRHYSYLISASPEGLDSMRRHRAELGALFPYFYTYPYAALDDPA